MKVGLVVENQNYNLTCYEIKGLGQGKNERIYLPLPLGGIVFAFDVEPKPKGVRLMVKGAGRCEHGSSAPYVFLRADLKTLRMYEQLKRESGLFVRKGVGFDPEIGIDTSRLYSLTAIFETTRKNTMRTLNLYVWRRRTA